MSEVQVAGSGDLPVIDLSRLTHDRPRALDALRAAAHERGFFHLVGHGISLRRQDEALAWTRGFFRLPQADRDALSTLNSPHFRGYTATGHELTGGRADRREQLDVAAERPAGPAAEQPAGPAAEQHVGAQPRADADAAYWRLEGPNQWPAALPELQGQVMGWLADVSAVAHRLLQALLASLGVDPTTYDEAFRDPHVHIKLLHYPATDGPNDADQGVGAHRDYGFLTLLLQDRNGGLEVLDGGRWQQVTPLPGAFVVNLGELFELATNGYLLATDHRVRSPRPGVDRFSLPLFYNPRLDALVDPLPLPAELAARARGVTADPANPLFRRYGDNALKGWLRAHPEVAQRHHADLLPH